MFLDTLSGLVTGLTPNEHTRFQCSVSIEIPPESETHIRIGTLIAAENPPVKGKDRRYTVLQITNAFPEELQAKTKSAKGMRYACIATPIGIELVAKAKKSMDIVANDTFPGFGQEVMVLNDEATASVLHQIAPESQTAENGSRIDIGSYGANPAVMVGLDYTTLIRGNAAIISSRPRARTTMTNNLVTALMRGAQSPLHIIYFDVNNMGTLSLMNVIHEFENASILALNDKFIPQSVYHSMKQPNDRQTHKRAVLDFLDMMILPSALENRRHDFVYPVSNMLRSNKLAIYRAHEQTIEEFIKEIRIDILEGLEPDIEDYVSGVLDGIINTYSGERFNEKNTKDILEMIDEFSQDAKNHGARRTLYDVRAEVQSVFETYSKDIPGTARKTLADIVNRINDESKSSFTIVQGQKPTDILRFAGSLVSTLIDERLKRLKIRVPVLFIFNNADDFIPRTSSVNREPGGDRFQEIIQLLLTNGRRHGLGFCLTLEQAGALEGTLARRIQSYFIGSLRFREDPEKAAELMNVSDELVRPASVFEDGCFLYASADSPYHRRVPLPVCTKKNIGVLYDFLDAVIVEQERRRKELQAQDDERQRKFEEQRRQEEERKQKESEDRERKQAEQAERREQDRRQHQERRDQDRRDQDRRDQDRRDQDRRQHDRRDQDRRDQERRDHEPRDNEPRDHDRQQHDRQQHDRRQQDHRDQDRQPQDRQQQDRQQQDRQQQDRQQQDRQQQDRRQRDRRDQDRRQPDRRDHDRREHDRRDQQPQQHQERSEQAYREAPQTTADPVLEIQPAADAAQTDQQSADRQPQGQDRRETRNSRRKRGGKGRNKGGDQHGDQRQRSAEPQTEMPLDSQRPAQQRNDPPRDTVRETERVAAPKPVETPAPPPQPAERSQSGSPAEAGAVEEAKAPKAKAPRKTTRRSSKPADGETGTTSKRRGSKPKGNS